MLLMRKVASSASPTFSFSKSISCVLSAQIGAWRVRPVTVTGEQVSLPAVTVHRWVSSVVGW